MTVAEKRKVLVMAAGGIGGYFGGLLAKQGHDVTFVARGAHLEAIRNQGLHVKSIDDEFVIKPAHAVQDVAGMTPVDLVLFGVKTYDTETAAQVIKQVIGPRTTVVTFQNGVESPECIGDVVGPEHVVAAPVQIETFIAAPGMIEQKSPFRILTLGEMDNSQSKRIEEIADLFRPFSVEIHLATDTKLALWRKFIRLAPVAGLATLARTDPFDLFKLEAARETLEAAMREIMAVGLAEGVRLDQADLSSALDWGVNMKQGIKPSMQKDIERGNRLEIDALSGSVMRLGKKHSLPTPVHQTIYVGLKLFDDRARLRREQAE